MVAETGCILTGSMQVELQHIKGSTFRHNKTDIGEWAIIALPYELHRDPTNPFSIASSKRAFEGRYGNQWDILLKTIEIIHDRKGYYPPDDVMEAIMDLAPGGMVSLWDMAA